MAGSLQKILLVEDNTQIIDLYSMVLKKSGYDLVVATTVDQALEQAREFHPDVILLDIMLPGGKTGLDALMILRTDKSYGCSDAYIIMLTNLGIDDKLEKAWHEYADGYVVKAEIVPHELPQIIESLNASEANDSASAQNS